MDRSVPELPPRVHSVRPKGTTPRTGRPTTGRWPPLHFSARRRTEFRRPNHPDSAANRQTLLGGRTQGGHIVTTWALPPARSILGGESQQGAV